MKRSYLIVHMLFLIGFSVVLLSNEFTNEYYGNDEQTRWHISFDARHHLNRNNSQRVENRAEQFCREYREAEHAYPLLPSHSLSKEGYEAYFKHHSYTSKEILNAISYYKNDEFVSYVKTLPDYEETIDALYDEYVGAFF
jgi:hypothetical protein